jgi:hypothetical protein
VGEIFIQGYSNELNEAKKAQETQSDETGRDAGSEQSNIQMTPATLFSRDSSKSSACSRFSYTTTDSDELTEMDHLSVIGDDIYTSAGSEKVLDVDSDLKYIHSNTATWDALLVD